MRAGAHDYVLKGDLTRLPLAVEREMLDCQVRAERARMRERLLLSERLVSVGTLAAGLAHEINNPLAVALANLECLLEAVAPKQTSAALRCSACPLKPGGEHSATCEIGDLVSGFTRNRPASGRPAT